MAAVNDTVARSMEYIFEADQQAVKKGLIELLELHTQAEAGAPRKDIMNIALKFRDMLWVHPDRPRQVRGMPATETVQVLPEHEQRAQNLMSDMQLLEKDTKRAHKTLTQLVRGVNTDQDIRDNFPECLIQNLELNHLPRTREPAWRIAQLDQRLYASVQRDIEMIEGYFNARYFMR
jgi:hypothetical protein